MNLPLLLMVAAAKEKIQNLNDDDFKQVAQEMEQFIENEKTRRGRPIAGH